MGRNKSRNAYFNACFKKIKHRTIADAKKHLNGLSVKGERWLNIYKCRFCKHYHIGHMPRCKRQKAIRKARRLRERRTG